MINIEINDLEREQMAIISFYKKQIEAFRMIKKESEKVQWADANYDMFVNSMNEIGRALSKMIQTLSNGRDVYIISELISLAREYVENERSFPKI